jgi:predicted double-glycine peptidase
VGSSILGRITIHTGEKRFMVMSNAKGTTLQVTNETYLPSKIQSASYEATFNKRNKSV